MKERPILFKPDMIRGILEDRKTHTRRIIRPPFEINANGFITRKKGDDRFYPYECPYGVVGDRLWVKETFFQHGRWVLDGADPVIAEYHWQGTSDIRYVADGWTGTENGMSFYRKLPSIFMSKKFARIWLEIVEVRVEQLQDITDEDAKEEGVITRPEMWDACYIDGFMRLWDSINEKRGYSWESNPLVWVIKFNRVSMKN